VIEFAFFNDAFVRLAAALDPVLDLSIAARKLTEHFVVASSCIPIREAPIQTNALPDFESTSRGRLQLPNLAHDGTRNEVIQAWPQVSQIQ